MPDASLEEETVAVDNVAVEVIVKLFVVVDVVVEEVFLLVVVVEEVGCAWLYSVFRICKLGNISAKVGVAAFTL